ncbi:hypothetical protein GH733_008357 [Mirounga leonina]|nr:hypothetical protein GH733_008357 [Mirounga leonina]
MNLSSEHCNISDWLRLEATVKASVYTVAFFFATFVTVIIIMMVSQNSKLKKEVRYILLCHHLLCISSYCGLGVVFQGMRALLANSPVLMCWVVFGVQLSVGEGILFTLALMAVNTTGKSLKDEAFCEVPGLAHLSHSGKLFAGEILGQIQLTTRRFGPGAQE